MNLASKKVLERHGAKNHRILVGAVSATGYGAIVNSSEFDDMEALGAAYDAIMADEEVITMSAQAMGAETPYVTQGSTFATEIPLGRPQGSKGRVVAAYVSTPLPGRFEAAVGLCGQVCEIMQPHGARNCRLWQQQANGVMPDVLALLMEWDTMRSYGKSAASVMSDPGLQSVMALMQGSDSPVRMITSEIYTEIGG